MQDQPNVKLCECGCGQPAPIAARTNTRLGHVAGQPTRFLRGHTNRRHRHRPGFKGSVRERLLRGILVDPETGCWEWRRRRDSFGYGEIAITDENGQRKVRAHRVSYEEFVGPIPDGLQIRHRCDNAPCINPDHLILGTQADNIRDMWDRGRASPPPH